MSRRTRHVWRPASIATRRSTRRVARRTKRTGRTPCSTASTRRGPCGSERPSTARSATITSTTRSPRRTTTGSSPSSTRRRTGVCAPARCWRWRTTRRPPSSRRSRPRRTGCAPGSTPAAHDAAAGWSTWVPERATAENGPELVADRDGSLRSVAHRPETSVYVLDGRAPAGADRLRLEVLPDRTLPSHGPGRSGSGNFVLNEVRVLMRATADEAWRAVAIRAASATFEQDTSASGGGRYPVQGAIDQDPSTGWAIAPQQRGTARRVLRARGSLARGPGVAYRARAATRRRTRARSFPPALRPIGRRPRGPPRGGAVDGLGRGVRGRRRARAHPTRGPDGPRPRGTRRSAPDVRVRTRQLPRPGTARRAGLPGGRSMLSNTTSNRSIACRSRAGSCTLGTPSFIASP